MKLTLKDLIEKSDSLIKLLQKEVPIKAAYKLGDLSIAIKTELQKYESFRNDLIKKYGKEINGEIQIDIEDKEALEKFMKENDELLSVEITIDTYEPISINELGDIKMDGLNMGKLKIFFKE